MNYEFFSKEEIVLYDIIDNIIKIIEDPVNNYQNCYLEYYSKNFLLFNNKTRYELIIKLLNNMYINSICINDILNDDNNLLNIIFKLSESHNLIMEVFIINEYRENYNSYFSKENEILNFIKLIKEHFYKDSCFIEDFHIDLENLIFLINTKFIPFCLSFYDANINNDTFINRLKSCNNKNTQKINEVELQNRLILLHNSFGNKFFKNYNISTITNRKYNEYNYYNKIDYFQNVCLKITAIFKLILIHIYDFKESKNNINNLLKSSYSKINNNTILFSESEEYNSEESSELSIDNIFLLQNNSKNEKNIKVKLDTFDKRNNISEESNSNSSNQSDELVSSSDSNSFNSEESISSDNNSTSSDNNSTSSDSSLDDIIDPDESKNHDLIPEYDND